MSYPIGQYHCKLDAKGRLMVPADCKDQLGDLANEGFVLRPGLFSKCLELYTMSDWMQTQDKLKGLNQFVRANVELVRKYNAGAKLVRLDSTGRLLIPKNLIDEGGLQKEVILTSLTVKMELWDADAYQTEINRIDETEFEKLATEKLGNINFVNE
ncbi:MAG: division/cell wall cluster transcriptional repressor MraZ [Bacteroidales bacterium]|nr:division/cell wall cluster transcriptional repressor MraZ [Bacteroidales bacterium]